MMIKMLLMMLLKLKWWSNWNIVECDNEDDDKVDINRWDVKCEQWKDIGFKKLKWGINVLW